MDMPMEFPRWKIEVFALLANRGHEKWVTSHADFEPCIASVGVVLLIRREIDFCRFGIGYASWLASGSSSRARISRSHD